MKFNCNWKLPINFISQSAKRKLLLNNPTDRTFENRRSRYKELGKKVPQAYRVYVEDTFLPCDAGDARIFSKEETGLYYYGARYLDPKYSRWLSGDPALNDYIPNSGENTDKLPNGGVYNIINLHVFSYGNNNPVKYNDPSGEIPIDTIWDAVNVGIDLIRMGVAKIQGDDEGFKSAAIDLGLDAAALSIPYLPAGISKIKSGAKLTVTIAQAGKGIYDSGKDFYHGDIAGGFLTLASTGVGVTGSFMNMKLDTDIAAALKRKDLVPDTMKIDCILDVCRSNTKKGFISAAATGMKSTSSAYTAYKFESKSNDSDVFEQEKRTNIISRPIHSDEPKEMQW
ncbi:hypothetical protein E4O04_10325 [Treponema sp. OMZ 799]|nr:RHS repeat-associated core domain-containing protein [Treponema sp. OMZ 799]UTC78377.1 hypothetical protein E4O04_10325 [Treponema sp. OMZ 799]